MHRCISDSEVVITLDFESRIPSSDLGWRVFSKAHLEFWSDFISQYGQFGAYNIAIRNPT
eukprot:10959542-Ditylum_brightwellii.AAC.1